MNSGDTLYKIQSAKKDALRKMYMSPQCHIIHLPI